MLVKDIMTESVYTAKLGSSVRDIIAAMEEGHFRHVPVLDQGEVIGMVSERDLAGVASFVEIFDLGRESYENFLNLPLFKILKKRFLISRDIVVVDASAPISTAAKMMVNLKFHSLPVVDGDRANLVGIISYIDLLHALLPLDPSFDHLDGASVIE